MLSDDPYKPPKILREPIISLEDFMVWFCVIGVFVLGFISGIVITLRMVK